ncbi:hypothetical protein V5N11_016214 [Cardamine amara subsp. amara]|uniref:RNase H type-1 domain-containing protein n=1 Tax=Cardamine amara subsp. amara TaxID=228776 RepID=A0ABD1BVF2_CARAN
MKSRDVNFADENDTTMISLPALPRVEYAEDQIVNQGSKSQSFVSSTLMGEALAMRESLDYALELGCVTLHLESDSKSLINAIRYASPLTEIHGVLEDIQASISAFSFISSSYISRDANYVNSPFRDFN